MDYGMIAVPAAPVRKKSRHQSEMTTQLLFGEKVKLIKAKGPLWIKVRSLHDEYEGWMTRNLLFEINKEDAVTPTRFVTAAMINSIQIQSKEMQLPFGASLPFFEEGVGRAGVVAYSFTGTATDRFAQPPSAELLRHYTLPWLNAPYMWGGRTIFGVDCSGFVQVNFKMMGLDMPRDAWQQAQQGTTIKKLSDALCGDLAFFDDKDEIVHVGILLNSEEIIHASGKVRIDTIDKKGIINSDTNKRTHSLRLIKRCW